MATELRERVVIVTGGNSGVGRATSLELAKCGMKVVIAGRRAEKNEEVVKEIESAGGEAVGVQCDVGASEQVSAMVRKTVDAFGTVDAMVNNAGMPALSRILDTTDDEWHLVMHTHVDGTFYCSREAYRVMKEKGRGHIISVASVAAHWPDPRGFAYGVAKTAQVKLTAQLWHEFMEYANAGKKGDERTFFVHGLMPIGINTPFYEHVPGAKLRAPGRLEAEQVAEVIRDVLRNPEGDRAFFEKLYEDREIHIHALPSVEHLPYILGVGLKPKD